MKVIDVGFREMMPSVRLKPIARSVRSAGVVLTTAAVTSIPLDEARHKGMIGWHLGLIGLSVVRLRDDDRSRPNFSIVHLVERP